MTSTTVFENTQHFPDLKEGVFKKQKLPPLTASSQQVVIHLTEDDLDKVSLSSGKEKTQFCKSVLNNTFCSRKNNCSYAHYTDEIYLKDCLHGEKCNRYVNNKHNPCLFIHTYETYDMYLSRLNIKKDAVTRPIGFQRPKFTKLCKSFYDKSKCELEDKCTFAHSIDQLVIKNCGFNATCRHVIKQDGEYVNVAEKVCNFLHLNETLQNYEKRVLQPKFKEIQVVPITVPVVEENVQAVESSDKIYLKVPKHMALEIMKLLMDSGKTNIDVTTY
jgi:hypothetical protein